MSYPHVVRVFATTQEPDYDCPWQAQRPSSGSGSGVLIGSNEILTGAHVVANATFLQVQRIANPDKAVAQVKAICHDCDLALLEVEDSTFAEGITPAPIGQLPDLREKVQVVGFPIGGEEISITEGVVSRIEVQRYRHSQRHLLAVTVDAAINRGNSGGPVFRDGMVVGVAFQKLCEADNIGEMVPAPLIRSFLERSREGSPIQIPGLGIQTQNLENPLLREHLQLTSDETGVLVSAVEYGSSAWGELSPKDVLLAIDDMPIANSGTVAYRSRYRTRFDVALSHRAIGDRLALEIKREGQRLAISPELKPVSFLVPRSQYDVLPTYFIYGGLVFQPLSRDFLSTWDRWWEKAPAELLQYYYSGLSTPERQEIVILSQVLSDELNIGYDHLYYEAIETVNGCTPRDMIALMRQVESTDGVLELRTAGHGVIALDSKTVRERNQHILGRYHIAHDRSPDLLQGAR
jgi:S1-C subfamily serine protease